VDVRVALALFWMYAPTIALVLFVQFAYEVRELLEIVSLNARSRLVELERELGEAPGADRGAEHDTLGAVLARDGLGYRVTADDGTAIETRGLAASAASSRAPRSLLLDALLLRGEDQLLLDGTPANGRRVTLVVSMRRFSIERSELLRATGISLGVGIALAMLISAIATRRALSPLRAASRASEQIALDRLDARLPLRGTGDDVDRHAAAVNRVLDRLEAGFRRIQEFNHDVAHELRTPIHRILNTAEVSLLAGRGEPETRHALEVIRDSAEGMGQVVDALLLLAREGEGSLERRAVLLETDVLFEALEKVYAPVFDENGVRLERVRGSSAVRGDATLLLRALSNLMDNALRHTPEGGTVRMEEALESGAVCMRISDSGSGVPEADRARIFHRFVRLEAGGSLVRLEAGGGDACRDAGGEARGAGLGLPIARMIARVHGGGLAVESSALGGACFVLRLPSALPSA
jgi:two-component system heavy metal sensor histidine kinase CusS